MTTTPTTWERPAAGNVPEYTPTEGIKEHDNGTPVHATLAHPPKDVHSDLLEREGADPFGYGRDEALEPATDIEEAK